MTDVELSGLVATVMEEVISDSKVRISAGQSSRHVHSGMPSAPSAIALTLALMAAAAYPVFSMAAIAPVQAPMRGSWRIHVASVALHVGLHRFCSLRRAGITSSTNGSTLLMLETDPAVAASAKRTIAGSVKSSPLHKQSSSESIGSEAT